MRLDIQRLRRTVSVTNFGISSLKTTHYPTDAASPCAKVITGGLEATHYEMPRCHCVEWEYSRWKACTFIFLHMQRLQRTANVSEFEISSLEATYYPSTASMPLCVIVAS